jgi:phosphoribosylformylglycinamidine cyclo-ligase
VSVGQGRTYAAAGVSLATAEGVVGRLRAAVESTGARGFGAFAGVHPLDDRRLLVASTDSIGSKPMVARPRGELRACGADMAAHCINDVITTGAAPLILLDFAATCVGIVERDALVDGSRVAEGDAVVGLPSAGVHANGFTLVRSVLEEEEYDGADLLAPTRLYLADVRRLLPRAKAFAHVTGGGILGNLSRALPDGLRAELDWDSWERPPVFAWLARHVAEDELRRVFNLGIGYCAVVAEPEPGELVIGRVVPT